MMMSPMLSPIRADTLDEVSSPEHGGVAALVEVASLDDAIGTISSGDEMLRRPTQQAMKAAVTLTWPSPNGRIARTISEQIDSSPAAQAFEDEMLRHGVHGSPRDTMHRVSPAAVASGFDGSAAKRKQTTEAAAAVCIQASFRGRRGRAHVQQLREATTRAAEVQQRDEQLLAQQSTVVKMPVTDPCAGAPLPNDEHIADPQLPQTQARSTRRQLQFDDAAPVDAEGVSPVTQACQHPLERLPPPLLQLLCCPSSAVAARANLTFAQLFFG
jgi:hypothetical protein